MTTITFVRHGITDYNIQRRAQGHLNNPLNETGRKQAAAVGKRLAEETWDIIVSSDLLRTRETAEIISTALVKPISFLDSRLREIYRGQIEGTVEEERIARWGNDWKQLDLGEESVPSVRKRGMSFVKDITAQYPDNKILIISHGFLIGQTLKGLLEDETAGNDLHNTSVTTLKLNGKRWECLLYDCIKHV